MKLAMTIHTLMRSKKEIAPNTVIELPDDEFPSLAKIGAVRDLTEAELKLHEMTQRPAEKPKAPKTAAAAPPAPTKADPEPTEPTEPAATSKTEDETPVDDMDRDALKAEADELSLEYPKNIPTPKLRDLVKDAKASGSDDDSDQETLV